MMQILPLKVCAGKKTPGTGTREKDKHARCAEEEDAYDESSSDDTPSRQHHQQRSPLTPMSQFQLTFPPKRKNRTFIISDVYMSNILQDGTSSIVHPTSSIRCSADAFKPLNASVRCSAEAFK